MNDKNMYSVDRIKAMGKNRTKENFSALIRLFFAAVLPLEIKREIVSSIGRYDYDNEIFDFISREAFNTNNPMEVIYQMFRTCLYKSKDDKRFDDLRQKIMLHYSNEVINKANAFYNFNRKPAGKTAVNKILKPMLLIGDSQCCLSAILNRL